MKFALGDYAQTADPELFMHRDGAHPTGEMDLLGARFVVVSETEQDRRLAESTMKRLTGGDTIKARRMRQDFVEFEPSHLAVLVTNHLPKARGDDPAVWRRIRVVPFNVVIPEEERADSSERRNGDGLHTSGCEGLPETDVARVQRWCRDRMPERVRRGMGESKKLLRSPGTEGRLMPWRSSTSGSPWIPCFAGPGRPSARARNRGLGRAGMPVRCDRSCPATAAYSSPARA